MQIATAREKTSNTIDSVVLGIGIIGLISYLFGDNEFNTTIPFLVYVLIVTFLILQVHAFHTNILKWRVLDALEPIPWFIFTVGLAVHYTWIADEPGMGIFFAILVVLWTFIFLSTEDERAFHIKNYNESKTKKL